MPRPRLSHEGRVLLLSLLGVLPAAAIALILMWTGDFSAKVQWTLTVFVIAGWVGCAVAVRERVVRPLQTMANLLAALREEDFSIRGRLGVGSDSLGSAMAEVNALGETLRKQRLGAIEASALLEKVMAEIDVAVFAFDGDGALRLVNRAAERLCGAPAVRLVGKDAASIGLGSIVTGAGDAPRTLTLALPGGQGQWLLRRSSFRLGGLPHTLAVLTDVGRALRDEERQAWQRLVRVLGHEINNSLTPIRSIAGNLKELTARTPRPEDWEQDVAGGLQVIERRSDALGRFMTSYARLAGLPRPALAPLDVSAWVRRNVALESRLPVEVVAGPELTVRADGDQLDQLLINLIRNAVDAALETGGGAGVTVRWLATAANVDVVVEDDGPGLADTANLFVPFFTTKPNGSGIGLPLSRQIAEAHGGALTLENRRGRRGCAARLRLPR